MNVNIREFCGDYALDIKFPDETVTLYFKSYQNALNVKRIIEIDNSIPNVATVADFVEVVRCKDCKFYNIPNSMAACYAHSNNYCNYGERKEGENNV